MKFTDEELEMLSNGLLALISNAVEAQKLIGDQAAHRALDIHIKAIQKLNTKICIEQD